MQITTPRSRVVAVLGPTNTGKTHFALERMLGHATGMIGFPLRLLARENYERAVSIKGAGSVALITGEEKILPLGARYFLCTVESMPVDRRVAFVGIDEIQMCGDPDRGHVFTDRLLHTRGEFETMLMGANTVRPLIKRLVPEAEFMARPRYSTLSYTGQRKTARLPKRSAVVAFSAADVYAIAELVRRQRGGAAVVMGALSPRTRNAQVDMYQNGEVDYLVATDAIGMGLNMAVDHVAFAATRKFDGRVMRDLTASEFAQIAGRAGRHMNDGTFGTTAEATSLDPEMVARVENHQFDAVKQVFWRNPVLHFGSVAELQQSLAVQSDAPGLVRAREADDEIVLSHLSRDPEIAGLAKGADAVETLWEVCQIPDFRKVMSDAHARLLGIIYGHLMGPVRSLPADWLAAQVSRLDRVDGDIDTLTQRIAGIRIWTYVSFRPQWVEDAAHWQERTREIEDRLSDALHERLTQRFVDKRTALLVSRLKEREKLLAAVNADGDVLVEGHFAGRLEGFRFIPETDVHALGGTAAAKSVSTATGKALRGEISDRVKRLVVDDDSAFSLNEEENGGFGHDILWRGNAVARLGAGHSLLKPSVTAITFELLEPADRESIERRLRGWVDRQIGSVFAPLAAAEVAVPAGAARGIVFRLTETLGSVSRQQALDEIDALSKGQRQALRKLGVRIGREAVYLPELLRRAAVRLRGLLWELYHGMAPVPPLPPPGRVSVAMMDGVPGAYYEAVGFCPMGRLAVRMDMVERLAGRAWSLNRSGPFSIGPDLLSLAGCNEDDMAVILGRLGYQGKSSKDKTLYRYRSGPPSKGAGEKQRKQTAAQSSSPFAKLKELAVRR